MNNHKSRKRLARTGGEESAKPDRDIQARIDRGLRAMHDEIARQGVPDRIVELLATHDQQTKGRPGKD